MNDLPSTGSELTIELFERSAVVLDLEQAQIDAWCSGLWSAWETEAEIADFIAYCQVQGGPVAALVCRSLATLAVGPVAEAAGLVAGAHADSLPAGTEPGSRPKALEAWNVTGPASRSIVFGYGSDRVSDHAILIELNAAGEMADLFLGGDPHELVYGVKRAPEEEVDGSADEESGLEELTIASCDVDEALAEAAGVWRAASAHPQLWSSAVRANEHLVRQRLDTTLPPLQHERLDLDKLRGMSEAEFADANRAALSTLQSALGSSAEELMARSADQAIEAAWIAVISGDVSGLPVEEQRAVLFLEWADWLGAGIGMTRQGPNRAVDGETLVDMVNRCPEVSTTIDKRDRDYVAFGFDVALELVGYAGGIADGTLTESGHAALARAMATAWS